MSRLWLPYIPDPQTARMRDLVAPCNRFLKARHISSKLVVDIARHPDRYWKRKVIIKGDKKRICYSPNRPLRRIQHYLCRFLVMHSFKNQYDRSFHNPWYPAVAFYRGASVVENARYHRNNVSSWCIDLKDAFASISFADLDRYLDEQQVFADTSIYPGAVPEARWVFCRLFTYRGCLRQGAPTAPTLFNLVMRDFDVAMAIAIGAPIRPDYTDRRQVKYTRYGDDLCFSSPAKFFPPHTQKVILEVLARYGFTLSDKRQWGSNRVLSFPGVVVINHEIRPPREYAAKLQQAVLNGLNDSELHGHRGYLGQFSARACRRALQPFGINPQQFIAPY